MSAEGSGANSAFLKPAGRAASAAKVTPRVLPEIRMIPKAVVSSAPAFRLNEFFMAPLMSSFQVGYKFQLTTSTRSGGNTSGFNIRTRLTYIPLSIFVPSLCIRLHQASHALFHSYRVAIILIVLSFKIDPIGFLRRLKGVALSMHLGAGWWRRMHRPQLDRLL